MLEEATKYLAKGAGFAEIIGQRYWCQAPHHFLGEICFYNKNYSAAKHHFNKTITYMEKFKYLPSWLNLNKLALARIGTFDNETSIDYEPFIFYEAKNKVKQYEGWILNYLTEILLNFGDENLSKAENMIKKAIKANQRNGMEFHLGKDYVLYSKLLQKKENIKNAKENLHRAIDIFHNCKAEGWVEKYEKKLACI